MSNLVIVAIPDENDRVWKVSSEKVPHLTILYLGDASQVSNLESIVQFVEHAANMTLGRFYLPVDRREAMGADDADTLIFKKGRYDYKAIRDFRVQLLKDSNIRTAYDSVAQFEGPWIPHLTLGYPANPAKPEQDPYPFYDVSFNKIAVWADDYAGPEFLLKDPWDDWGDYVESPPIDVAMSETSEAGAEFLEGTFGLSHHGVKGMHWGVRKDGSSGSDVGPNNQALKVGLGGGYALLSPALRNNITAETKAKTALFGQFALLDSGVRSDLRQASTKVNLAKSDKSWEKDLANGQAYVAVHNKVAEHFNSKIDAVNNKYPADHDWSKEDYSAPKDPTFKKYVKDVHALTKDSIEKATNDLNLKNPSGTKEVKVQQDPKDPLTFKMTVHDKEAKHAAADQSSEITFKVKYSLDAKGRITGFELDNGQDTMAQSAEDGAEFMVFNGMMDADEFLDHFGVKGMQWGVRKPPPMAVATSATSRVPHGSKRKTKIEVDGGENHPAHQDALEVAQVKAKLKKSGTAALSNDDLQKLNKRLQLETQAAQLTSSRGQKFIQRQLEQTGQQTVQAGIRKGGVHAVKKGAKRAGKAAATTAVTVALI